MAFLRLLKMFYKDVHNVIHNNINTISHAVYDIYIYNLGLIQSILLVHFVFFIRGANKKQTK